MNKLRSACRALLQAVSVQLTRPSVRWVGATTLLCLALGLGFAALSALALMWGGGSAHAAAAPRPADLLSGICLTALAYAALGAGYGLLSAPLAAKNRGRWLAAAGLGVLVSSALFATLVSSGVRWYSGSYLTLGALQFTLNSLGHVSGAAAARHGITLLAVGGVCLATVFGVTAHLGRARAGEARSSAQLRSAYPSARLVVAALVVGGAAMGISGSQLRGGLLQTTPELAFVASLATPARAAMPEVVRAPASPAATASAPARPAAPELSAGEAWKTHTLAPDAPNVLLIVLESVAQRYLGYAGGPAGVTPHLDALATGSLQQRRTWTTATHSNYAQMAVLSSLFPRRGLGLDTYERLDYPRVLLHDIAHAHGYATATISSQDESWQGMARFQDTGTPTTFIDARVPGRANVDIGTETIAADHETATRAISWLNAQSGRWSLYVNFQSTHFPYALPKGVRRPFTPHAVDLAEFKYLRYEKSLRVVAENRYKNALRYVDQQIGRLTQWLSDTGQLDDTLIIVTSDHGELFFEHGLVTHGRTLFEEESRVPLLVHWPRKVSAQISDRPASTLDVLPTIVDAMGLPPHPAHQGSSLLSAQQPASGVFLNIQGLRGVEGLVCWPHKLTRDWATGRYRLFDLASDPHETTNLSKQDPARVARLGRVLDRFMIEQDEYHREDDLVRTLRYAPRLPSCPAQPPRRVITASATAGAASDRPEPNQH